jgi:hypothetical protein
MTFSELKKDAEENEYIEEIKVKTLETRKLWALETFETEIAKLDAEILERQERKAELEEQLEKFTKKVK